MLEVEGICLYWSFLCSSIIMVHVQRVEERSTAVDEAHTLTSFLVHPRFAGRESWDHVSCGSIRRL